MSKTPEIKPVRRALRTNSTLLPLVQDGLGALKRSHLNYFDATIRSAFADSLDADAALLSAHVQENRWDYLLGHRASQMVIAIEPHSAKQDEISTVIKKRSRAIEQLRPHLQDGVRIARWFWVASGKVHFANTEKVRIQLDQNGIEFVGKRLLEKHLPAAISLTSSAKKVTRRKKK